jgi:hypothetical protein
MRKLILLLSIFFVAFRLSAQQVELSGKITDQKNMPVSYASVYLKNTSYGTTSNENGEYTFKLKPGVYNIIYRVVGYKQKTSTVTMDTRNEQLDVQLQDEPFELKASNTKEASKYDPAMDIMRKVVSKREYYLKEVKSYSCIIYIKGVKQIISLPQTILAKGLAKVLKLDSNKRGISYQSESLSTYSFEQPHKVKEVFIASKVAGSNPPFGYNKASDLQVNFYNDLFYVDGLSTHGFVSPVSDYAFKYYKFKLLGTIIADGKVIDKIQVISRIGKALSFSGTIYIMEGDWRIYSVDLFLTKAFNNLNYIDTLKVKQQYIPIGNTWEPLTFQYIYSGSVQGLKFDGYYLGINNNYKIDTTFKQGYFTGEILHVDTAANKRNDAYWAANRPVPLTVPEANDYHKKDSIGRLQESRSYLDSVQHNQNKFRPFPYIIKGHLSTYNAHKDSLYIYPLLQTVYYNTVEGYGIYLKGIYSQKYDDNRSVSLSPTLRYGFANKLFSANIRSAYTYDQEHAGRLFFSAGSDLLDLNNLETHSLYFNTLSTLLSEQNFVKYYRSIFGDIGFQRELANGVLWTANISYADRQQLYNISFNHIITYKDVHYTSNNPLVPDAPADDRSVLFPENRALIFTTAFRFTFDQQYITRPTGKVLLPSRYPVITVNYRKGINGVFSSDVNYDFLSLDISQDYLSAGLFGHTAYKIKVGGFVNKQSVFYPDYNHFLGNQGTTSDPTYVGVFHFLPFYTFSTQDPFLEVHVQHNFGGAVFDNIPFLRRLKLEEIIGANYLTEKNNPYYSEFYFGIKRLIFGIDYGVAYQGNKKYLQGFRIFYGLK